MSIKEDNPLLHLTAGAAAGTFGVLATSPLEVLKTRQQSTVSSYSSRSVHTNESSVKRLHTAAGKPPSLRAQYHAIVAEEGFRGLYKGLTPSIGAVASSKALFFWMYSECRKHVRKHCNQGQVVHLTSGTLTGLINSIILNPFWVIKTKLQLDEKKCSRSAVRKTIKEMWAAEPYMRAFFRGSSASIVGSFEFGMFFLIYEELKPRSAFTENNYLQALSKVAFASTVSKIVSSTCLYPTEVIRTRLREDLETPEKSRKYRKFWRTCSTIYKEEGLNGMYRGWVLHLFKTVPFTMITFGVYELVLHLFQRQDKRALSY